MNDRRFLVEFSSPNELVPFGIREGDHKKWGASIVPFEIEVDSNEACWGIAQCNSYQEALDGVEKYLAANSGVWVNEGVYTGSR